MSNKPAIYDGMTLLELQPLVHLNQLAPRFREFFLIPPDSSIKFLFQRPNNSRELGVYPKLSEHACRGCTHLVVDVNTKATHLFIDGFRQGGTTESGGTNQSPDYHSGELYTICGKNSSKDGVSQAVLQKLSPHTPHMTIHAVGDTQTCPKNSFQKK